MVNPTLPKQASQADDSQADGVGDAEQIAAQIFTLKAQRMNMTLRR